MQLDHTKLLGFKISSSAKGVGAKLGDSKMRGQDPKNGVGTYTMGAKLADIKRRNPIDPKRD